MKSEITKIGESEELIDKLGNTYKLIEFEKIKPEFQGKAILNLFTPINASINRTLLRLPEDIGYLEPIGTKFIGDIIKREVHPYSFLDKNSKVTTTSNYSVVIFGDSESQIFPHLINKAFEESGHSLIVKEQVKYIIAR